MSIDFEIPGPFHNNWATAGNIALWDLPMHSNVVS